MIPPNTSHRRAEFPADQRVGPSPTEGGRRQQQAVRPTCLYCRLPLPTADCWKKAGRSPNCF